ncbi:acyl carrier protein [Methylobacterium organophilum]|uniref:Aminoacyl carrier protein n=1 Tax=Methylobacterium organophilum TaxID=410 RepID=A0ABQ4T8Z1_METOR|nr:acyl carrier protein [Methylobacterium organophilum]GJE28068.1 Aminoacyl carrier protein [Methylobacterium organophilum]
MISLEDIREVVGSLEAMAGLVEGLGPDADLFEKGLTSFGSVQLMLALEERFEIEFPDSLLNRRSFSTLKAIRDTVASLTSAEAA